MGGSSTRPHGGTWLVALQGALSLEGSEMMSSWGLGCGYGRCDVPKCFELVSLDSTRHQKLGMIIPDACETLIIEQYMMEHSLSLIHI